MPELSFPVSESGKFLSAQEQEDARILAICEEYKVMPHLVKKTPDGKYTINDMSLEAYGNLYSGDGLTRGHDF